MTIVVARARAAAGRSKATGATAVLFWLLLVASCGSPNSAQDVALTDQDREELQLSIDNSPSYEADRIYTQAYFAESGECIRQNGFEYTDHTPTSPEPVAVSRDWMEERGFG